MNFYKIKEKLNIKRLIALVVALVILFNLAVTVVISESFLNTEDFAQSERGQGLLVKPLSSSVYMKWLGGVAEDFQYEELKGICVKNNNPSHNSIVLVHSLTTTPLDMAVYAYHFYSLGFNVYIPEYITDVCTMGESERVVIADAINRISSKNEEGCVFVFGLGMGATTSILATTQSLPQNVKGIIADSPYSMVDRLFEENINEIYGIKAFPVLYMSSVYIKAIKGWDTGNEYIISAARDSEIPIMYIHGTEDAVVPVEHSNNLFEVTRAKGSEHVTIHGATHLQGLNTDSEKYWREVDAFIRNSIE